MDGKLVISKPGPAGSGSESVEKKEAVRLARCLTGFVGAPRAEPPTIPVKFFKTALESQKTAERDETFLEKPTNAFLYIRRLTEGWSHVTDAICGNQDEHDVEAKVFCLTFTSVVGRSSIWPSAYDLQGAAQAIIRLVEFYKLDFEGLANGTMHTVQVAPLAISDFVYIAEAALDDDQDYLALVWISNILRLLKKMSPEDQDTKMRLQRKLAALYYKHKSFSMAASIIGDALKENPNHEGARRDLQMFKARLNSGDELGEIPRSHFLEQLVEDMATFRNLCRGNVKSPLAASRLHCEYRQTRIPLIPSKVEYMNLVPPVILIHEIATEMDIEHMKNLAKFKLHQSVIGESMVTSPLRISQTAWLGEWNDALLRMSRKVELHTGLSALYTEDNSHAEPWQKEIRDLGGESVFTAVANSGDRVATFLLYLNDVTLGGATVFPKLKTRIPVVKLQINGCVKSDKHFEGLALLTRTFDRVSQLRKW
ncbi:prolyl 4-hydroxylase subunit alpha-2-like [Liolophura sinensis]|uniref:prolyl 4-hydroxylase subunit alpha-2-like n=1 Tax=Liolophura sinensis TaxID=3198878 RepID=UPI0031582781